MDPARPSGLSGTPAGHLSGGPAFVPSSGLSGTPASGRLSGVAGPPPVRPPPLPIPALDAARRADAIARSGGLSRPLSAAPALTAFRHVVGSASVSPDRPTYPPIAFVSIHPLGSMPWEDWVFSVENTGEIFSAGFDVVRSPEGQAVFPIDPTGVRVSYPTGTLSVRLPWEVYKEIIKSNQNPFLQGARILGCGPEREVISITVART